MLYLRQNHICNVLMILLKSKNGRWGREREMKRDFDSCAIMNVPPLSKLHLAAPVNVIFDPASSEVSQHLTITIHTHSISHICSVWLPFRMCWERLFKLVMLVRQVGVWEDWKWVCVIHELNFFSMMQVRRKNESDYNAV